MTITTTDSSMNTVPLPTLAVRWHALKEQKPQ